MTFIIITLLLALIGGIVTTFMNDTLLNGLYDIVFHADEMMTTGTGISFFETVSDVAYTVAMSLMILKFLKKGFDIYVLWTDGDPDSDPTMLLINFIRAVATALLFRWIYDIFVDLCSVVTNTILSRIAADAANSETALVWVERISTAGLVPLIACLIFMIFYLILLFQFMGRGVEMQVMVAGIPLACTGLLDNDKGIFKAYVNQFVKAFVTTIVQIMLLKIGLSLMMTAEFTAVQNIAWGIACLISAISMPKILREFLVPTGGNGTIGNTVFQTVKVANMAHNILK